MANNIPRFKKNPTVQDLVMALIPKLQEWCRNEILKPVWNTTGADEYGRKENYPRMERSIQYDMKHTITITIDLNMAASCIEMGRRKGKMPPVAAIQRWIVVKRIMPRNNQTIEQMNYAIRRHIAKDGTNPPPKKYLEKQMDKTPFDIADFDNIIDAWFDAFELLE